MRQRVYDKCNGHCAYCGTKITIKEMQVDHVISKYNWEQQKNHLPNVNHIDNLLPSCRYCNRLKDTCSLEVFREQVSLQLQRANDYSANYRMAKRYGQVIEQPTPIVFYFEKLNLLK